MKIHEEVLLINASKFWCKIRKQEKFYGVWKIFCQLKKENKFEVENFELKVSSQKN